MSHNAQDCKFTAPEGTLSLIWQARNCVTYTSHVAQPSILVY